jgi:hypothetical protein
VKSVGAAGGAAAFGANLTRVSAKERNEATKADVEAVLEADKTKQLFDEINNPNVQVGSAETLKADFGERELEITTLPTKFGEAVYGESDDGLTEAYFFFGGSLGDAEASGLSKGLRKQLPEQYRDIPEGSSPMLVVGEKDTALFRKPTEAESQRLSEVTGLDQNNMRAITSSNAQSFRVYEVVESQNVSATAQDTDGDIYDVDLTKGDIAYDEATASDFDTAQVSQRVGTQADCFTVCQACLQGTATCAACTLACASVVTGVGIIACGVCIATSCSGGGYACGKCADECANLV